MKRWEWWTSGILDRVSKSIGIHATLGLVYLIAIVITWMLGTALDAFKSH